MTKHQIVSLLKVFNVEGRTKLASGSKESIQNKLQSLQITQHRIEEMEISLVNKLENFGERDDFKLNQSFGNEDFLLEGIETDKSAGSIDGIDSIDSDDTDQPNETKRNAFFMTLQESDSCHLLTMIRCLLRHAHHLHKGDPPKGRNRC